VKVFEDMLTLFRIVESDEYSLLKTIKSDGPFSIEINDVSEIVFEEDILPSEVIKLS